jgi:hypothetical protein
MNLTTRRSLTPPLAITESPRSISGAKIGLSAVGALIELYLPEGKHSVPQGKDLTLTACH